LIAKIVILSLAILLLVVVGRPRGKQSKGEENAQSAASRRKIWYKTAGIFRAHRGGALRVINLCYQDDGV